jgi:pSer/pThr/pTyr-binding forkhead associated (FHA) protein
MSKLVLLSEGFAGRTYELNVEKTTVGRVEDNAFQIAEPSVSSHHAEIILKGNDVVIKDLNSTNGTFINGEKIGESVLKPGQTLKFGQVELRLEGKDGAGAPVPGTKAPPASKAPASPSAGQKQPTSQTSRIPRGGVKLDEFQEGKQAPKFQTTAFAKKSNKATIIFVSIAVVLVLAIVIFLVVALTNVRSTGP